MTGMTRVAVLSPSFAAPGAYPAVHEQALERLRALGLEPVEFPTTRQVGASPEDRARDITAAFADGSIAAVLASVGGNDQITVTRHLDAEVIRANPKPFLGYSDNTNLLNLLWQLGVPGFYGGSTQVQIGPGPYVEDYHLISFLAALRGAGEIEVTLPADSEDHGPDWDDPRALTEFGHRTPCDPLEWFGPPRIVEGRTWGGCLEVLAQLGIAGRFPGVGKLQGGILLLEASERLTPTDVVTDIVRALGEGGILGAVDGVMLARTPTTGLDTDATLSRREQIDIVADTVRRYNPDAVMCAGVPFGHTRPQWILPYGGRVRLDGVDERVVADYAFSGFMQA